MPVSAGGTMSNRPAPYTGPWKCPACGSDQQGRIEDGCSACGAGKPGRLPPPPPAQTDPEGPVKQAFTTWLGSLRGQIDADMEGLLYQAFQAGYEVGRGPLGRPEPPPLEGTVESRTLVAALQLFIDQVLSSVPEEVKTGEWLSADAARKLITRISQGGV